ncbi:MAG: PorV/PorQ family protein, partial [candidate division Zixibacteria bacterium]|nr:PorV/PorQ family protein [candidate division Zixibacteria bacterium]
MRRLLLGCMLFLLLPALAFGQAKVGTAGAQFLKIGVSARAVGMGEAFLAISDDASAIYYNPAGLVQLNGLEVMASHIDYPAGINYEFLGVAYPRFGGVWGLGFYMLNTGDMPLTDYFSPLDEDPYSSGQTFTAKEYALALSYGVSLTDRFSVGLTFKFIDELYEEERASGWAADAGTLYNTGFRGFKIAMAISNFGPDLKFIELSHPLPMNFKFGGSMDVIKSGSHKATIGLEGSHPNDNLEKFNGG